MPSLIELVENVTRGEAVAAAELAPYQQSVNSAERFLANHAGATLGLRECHAHLLESLTAIGFADRKVVEQYVGLCAFLGRDDEATGPTVAFGKSAVSRGEVALGVEAAASAVAQDAGRGGRWTTTRRNLVGLADLYAEAARREPRAGGASWTNTTPRVGYVTSALGDDEPAARAAAAFASHLDGKQFRLNVYATEGFVRRDGQQWAGWNGPGGNGAALVGHAVASHGAHNRGAAATWINNGYGAKPSGDRGRLALDRIERAGCGTWVAPTTGDSLAAARALADRVTADQTDLLIFDCDAADPIAAMVAAWRTAKKSLWIARRAPLYADFLDAVCYLDARALEPDGTWWRGAGVSTSTVVEGVDLSAEVGAAPRRGQYGIADGAAILATAVDDVARRVTPRMVEAVVDVLRRQPEAVFVIIGGGDTAAVRRRFDAAGVGRRVGYAGRRRDLAGFLRMADAYLCPFAGDAEESASISSPSETLVAMGVGLPALALSNTADAEAVGNEATASDVGHWVDRAAKLARDAAVRTRVGQQMRRRVEEHYSYAATAEHLQSIIGGLLTPPASIPVPTPTEAPERQAA